MIYLCIVMFTHQLYNDKDRAYQGNVEVYPILHQLEPLHGSSKPKKEIEMKFR